ARQASNSTRRSPMTSSPNASSDAEVGARAGAASRGEITGSPLMVARTALAAVCLVLALASLAPTASAQAAFHLGGHLSTRLGVDVEGDFTVAEVCAELEGRGEVGSGFFPDAVFLVEAGACYDAAAQAGSQGGVPTDVLDLLFPAPDPFRVWLGEAYATVYLGRAELSVGRQTVAWGSADALAPLDVVNPHDLSY